MIIQLEEAKRTLQGMRGDIVELGNALKIERIREQAEELEQKTMMPNFWDDAANASKVQRELKQIQDTIEEYENLKVALEDAITLADMGIEENDESVVEEVLAELANITAVEERMRLETLLSGEYDGCNAIVSFHPGAGGTEAQDWASMLYRMYNRWAENKGFTVKLLEWLDGDEAGLKSATILVEGPHAYGFLKSEHGVHRLVRVSPFDASGRRQTSFASVEVMPEFDDVDAVEIRDEDIEVTAHRSSGAGGQHINKTDSAVRIVHIPTGITVNCQEGRSQIENRETALRLIKSRVYEEYKRQKEEAEGKIRREKIGTGDRAEKIRTYNYPQNRVTDHRIGFTITQLDRVMEGKLQDVIAALQADDEKKKLEAAE